MNNPTIKTEIRAAIKTASGWAGTMAMLTAITMFGAFIIKGSVFNLLYFYLTIPPIWPLVWGGHFSTNPLGGGLTWCLYCITVNGVVGCGLGIVWWLVLLTTKCFISDLKKNFQSQQDVRKQ